MWSIHKIIALQIWHTHTHRIACTFPVKWKLFAHKRNITFTLTLPLKRNTANFDITAPFIPFKGFAVLCMCHTLCGRFIIHMTFWYTAIFWYVVSTKYSLIPDASVWFHAFYCLLFQNFSLFFWHSVCVAWCFALCTSLSIYFRCSICLFTRILGSTNHRYIHFHLTYTKTHAKYPYGRTVAASLWRAYFDIPSHKF